jgi:hypothetical protein
VSHYDVCGVVAKWSSMAHHIPYCCTEGQECYRASQRGGGEKIHRSVPHQAKSAATPTTPHPPRLIAPDIPRPHVHVCWQLQLPPLILACHGGSGGTYCQGGNEAIEKLFFGLRQACIGVYSTWLLCRKHRRNRRLLLPEVVRHGGGGEDPFNVARRVTRGLPRRLAHKSLPRAMEQVRSALRGAWRPTQRIGQP